MAKKTRTRPDPLCAPNCRIVKRPNDERPRSLNLGDGYWDSVIREVARLNGDEALELSLDEDFTVSMRSAARRAAARAGIKICVALRGTAVYLWALRKGNPGR